MTAPTIATTMTRWTPAQLATLRTGRGHVAPVIGAADLAAADPGVGYWDAWPLLTRAGALSPTGLWMALGAPWFDDPDERHAHARIHLIARTGDGWLPLGPAMPEGFAPGSRQWSGSACVEADGRTVTLYFTAAGQQAEPLPSFGQQLFEARATLAGAPGAWHLVDWRDLTESVRRDPRHYMDPQAGDGAIGTIKAFRDPGYFRDPASGRHWLFFTGSLAGSTSAQNGAIGAAVAPGAEPADWQLLPPVLGADGLNNELERPHVVMADGLYYLFWSTQAHVFDPAGPIGPTGLYGMVSRALHGGWAPLNGSGLVLANPPQAPRQAYSWLVLPDLSVTSFVDDWGRGADPTGPRRFGGTFAPFLHLALDGARAWVKDGADG